MNRFDKAKRILKRELAARGIGYGELVEKLNMVGEEETYRSVSSKISRGTFSFAFFLACVEAIGMKKLNLELEGEDSEG